jgi:hypothetical protein
VHELSRTAHRQPTEQQQTTLKSIDETSQHLLKTAGSFLLASAVGGTLFAEATVCPKPDWFARFLVRRLFFQLLHQLTGLVKLDIE